MLREQYLDSLRGIACLIVLLAHIVATDSTFGIYASGCGADCKFPYQTTWKFDKLKGTAKNSIMYTKKILMIF